MIKFFRFLCVTAILAAVFLTACSKQDGYVSMEIICPNNEAVVGGFDFSGCSVKLTSKSGRTEELPLTYEMLSSESKAKLGTAGTHKITVVFSGQAADFTLTLKNPPTGEQPKPEPQPEPVFKIGFLSDLAACEDNQDLLLEILNDFKAQKIDVLVLAGNIVQRAEDYQFLNGIIGGVFTGDSPELIPVMGGSEWFSPGLSEEGALEAFKENFALESVNYYRDFETCRIIAVSGADLTGSLTGGLKTQIEDWLNGAYESGLNAFVVFNDTEYLSGEISGICENYSGALPVGGSFFTYGGQKYYAMIAELNGGQAVYAAVGSHIKQGNEPSSEPGGDPQSGDLICDIVGVSDGIIFGYSDEVHSLAADRSFFIEGEADENFYPEVHLTSGEGHYDLSSGAISFNINFFGAYKSVTVYIYFEDGHSLGLSAVLTDIGGSWQHGEADFRAWQEFSNGQLSSVVQIVLRFNFDSGIAGTSGQCAVYIDSMYIIVN